MALASCGAGRERFKPIPIPAERVDCVVIAKEDRPKLVPYYVIDWAKVTTVAAAKIEVDRLMMTVLNREGDVVRYVLDLEDRVFLCANDAQWLREYIAQVEK